MNNANRPSDCPLVGMPEEHGKLIDADALSLNILRSLDYCDDILEIIEKQPVVENRHLGIGKMRMNQAVVATPRSIIGQVSGVL